MKQTGKAYLLPDNPELEDVFISSNNTGRALNGDRVRVHLFPARKGRRLEGRVVEILQRHNDIFVGVIKYSPNMSYFIPDDTSMPIDILIPNTALHGAKNGQKVMVVITEWSEHARNPFGEVKEVLGFPGDNDVEMKSRLIGQNFAPIFLANRAMFLGPTVLIFSASSTSSSAFSTFVYAEQFIIHFICLSECERFEISYDEVSFFLSKSSNASGFVISTSLSVPTQCNLFSFN